MGRSYKKRTRFTSETRNKGSEMSLTSILRRKIAPKLDPRLAPHSFGRLTNS